MSLIGAILGHPEAEKAANTTQKIRHYFCTLELAKKLTTANRGPQLERTRTLSAQYIAVKGRAFFIEE
jgi:hypothetical protein